MGWCLLGKGGCGDGMGVMGFPHSMDMDMDMDMDGRWRWMGDEWEMDGRWGRGGSSISLSLSLCLRPFQTLRLQPPNLPL